jgi:hypothetical protein
MFSSITSFVTGLIPPQFKLAALAIVIAFVTSAIGFAIYKYQSALSTIEEIRKQNTSLVAEKALLDKTNTENQEFIKNVKEDIAIRERIVAEFREQKIKDDKTMADLSKKIIAYTAKDDGPISKVLKDTISSIEHDREARLK